MFLVYNFSNSNVKYSLQRTSEHIKLMGQLSSVTVKSLGFLMMGVTPACHPTTLLSSTADSDTPSTLCQLSSSPAPQACTPQMTAVRLHWQEELG